MCDSFNKPLIFSKKLSASEFAILYIDMKSFKGSGKILKNTASSKKTSKKRTLSKIKFLKKYKTKTLKERVSKSTKQLQKIYELGDDTNIETYINTLNVFQILFKNILKEQKKLLNLMNNDKQIELDNVILEISDKLSNIESKGNILKRIKKESPEVYGDIQLMYKNINTTTVLPSYNLIEYYYEIIRRLLQLIDDKKLGTRVSTIITLLSIDLTHEFFNKEKVEKEELEEDLSDLFNQLKVSKNSVDDLLEGFGKIKI